MSTLSTNELIKVRDALARALSGDDVNQVGRDTGQAKRLRTVTPHRLFLAVVSALASAHVESLADLLRAFNYQNGVTVAYKAFYNRLARVGFAIFMREMFARLVERLSEQTLTPEGHGRRAVQGYCDPGRLVVCAQTDAARDVPGSIHDD